MSDGIQHEQRTEDCSPSPYERFCWISKISRVKKKGGNKGILFLLVVLCLKKISVEHPGESKGVVSFSWEGGKISSSFHKTFCAIYLLLDITCNPTLVVSPFRYCSTRETLFHELAHMVYSEHDENFWALYSKLLKESESLDWTKSAGKQLDPRTRLADSSTPYYSYSDAAAIDGGCSVMYACKGGLVIEGLWGSVWSWNLSLSGTNEYAQFPNKVGIRGITHIE